MPIGLQGFQKGHKSFWTEETKKKAREDHPRYWLGKKRDNPGYLEKISLSHKGQHSSPQTEFKKEGREWQGTLSEYRNIHKWVERQLGKPEMCSQCGKVGYGRQMHWANKSKKYLRKLNDWVRLCVKCHYHYDMNIKK